MSDGQILRSRLRKIVASDRVDTRQSCRTLGCDDYLLIDLQSEIHRHQFGWMPYRAAIEILESYVSACGEYAA